MTDRTDVWTYLSANSVTVPTNLTATYYVGLKATMVQGGVTKYFRIVGSSYNAGSGLTTIILDGFGTYTVANAPITAHSDMCAENVPGFPLPLSGTGAIGGQTLTGGTASGDDLTLRSTSHATKCDIIFGTSKYDEANNRLGIGRTPATYPLEVQGDIYSSGNVRGALIGSITETGPVKRAIILKTVDYAILDTDTDFVVIGALGAHATITLPTAVDNIGRIITVVIDGDPGVFNVIIDGEGDERINDATTKTNSDQYSFIKVLCNGTGWNIVGSSGTWT